MKKIAVISALLFSSISSIAAEPPPPKTILQDSDQQANLIIYRQADGFALNYRVIVDGKHVGKLKLDKAFGLKLPAGEHTVAINDANHTEIAVNIAEGATTCVLEIFDKKARAQLVEDELLIQNIAGLSFANIND
ncbi:hypothetical protein [Dasania marina]|uniref:hypothetical protein n=1 Tax=Dasania marina TaxID=471499 RepID=UPI0030DB0BE0|tara:strand:+ start:99155 stop:99559 length:405 start_codon:yes stop_codon:yes gene_type:complete